MNTYKCDRCGQHYEQQQSIDCEVETLGVTYQAKVTIQEGGREPDLCLPCITALLDIAVNSLVDVQP